MATWWDELSESIESFADDLCRERARSWAGLGPGVREELLGWTPRAGVLLEGGVRAWSLYAARVWHTLDRMVFSADEATRRGWLKSSWTGFAEMRDVFKGKFIFLFRIFP